MSCDKTQLCFSGVFALSRRLVGVGGIQVLEPPPVSRDNVPAGCWEVELRHLRSWIERAEWLPR